MHVLSASVAQPKLSLNRENSPIETFDQAMMRRSRAVPHRGPALLEVEQNSIEGSSQLVVIKL